MNVGQAAGFFDFGVAGSGTAQANVLANCVFEKERELRELETCSRSEFK